MHSNGKGIASSAIPYSRAAPAWLKTTPEQVVDQICKLAKKGATPSQIGVVLRDSHGVAQVKIVTGMRTLIFHMFGDMLTCTRKQNSPNSQEQRYAVTTGPACVKKRRAVASWG
jgi:small subunit ribosomal protein S13e